MKFNQKPLLFIYVVTVMLFTDLKMFAQIGAGPGDEGEDEGPVEGDDPALPVNGKLIWLLIVGALFAWYKIASRHKVSRS